MSKKLTRRTFPMSGKEYPYWAGRRRLYGEGGGAAASNPGGGNTDQTNETRTTTAAATATAATIQTSLHDSRCAQVHNLTKLYECLHKNH